MNIARNPYRPSFSLPKLSDPKVQQIKGKKVLTLKDAIAALQLGIVPAVACSVLAVGSAMAIVSQITPQFTSTTTLMMGPQEQAPSNFSDFFSGLQLDNKVIGGEIAIMRSNQVIAQVAKELQVDNVVAFNPHMQERSRVDEIIDNIGGIKDAVVLGLKSMLGLASSASNTAPKTQTNKAPSAIEIAARSGQEGQGEYQRYVGTLKSHLRIAQVGSSFLVTISATTPDPVASAALSNMVAEKYIDDRLDSKFEQTRRMSDWFSNRTLVLKRNLEESAERLQNLREKLATKSGTLNDVVDRQILQLSSNLITERATVEELTFKLSQSETILSELGYDAAADLLESPILQRHRTELANLRREEINLESRVGGENARLKTLRQSIGSLKSEIEVEVDRLITGQRTAVNIALTKVNSLQDTLEKLEAESIIQARDRLEVEKLERAVEENELIYDSFIQRFRQAFEIEELQQADAWVLAYGRPSRVPSSPRGGIAYILAGIGGIFFGLGIGFLRTLAPPKLHNTNDLQKFSGLNVVGELNYLPKGPKQATQIDAVMRGRESQLSTQIRNMRDAVLLGHDQPPRVISITSAEPTDSKITTAMLLAAAIKHSGRSVIIVDADLRNPTLAKAWNSPVGDDLVTYANNNSSIQEVIRIHDKFHIHYLPILQNIADPGSYFISGTFDKALFELKRMGFEHIIVLAGDVDSTYDGLAPSKVGDVVVLVVEAGKSYGKTIPNTLDLLERVGIERRVAVLSHDP